MLSCCGHEPSEDKKKDAGRGAFDHSINLLGHICFSEVNRGYYY